MCGFCRYSLIGCHIPFPVCLWIMDPHSRAPKKNTNHGNEVLPQDTKLLIQRPCFQRGSPCQDPAGNRNTRRPDHRKETQTAVAWTCLPFTRFGQNHLARHMKGGRRQGRQRKRLEGNIREWTGLEFSKSQREVKNRGKWWKLVVELSVVPQRLSRLRDRWWGWKQIQQQLVSWCFEPSQQQRITLGMNTATQRSLS